MGSWGPWNSCVRWRWVTLVLYVFGFGAVGVVCTRPGLVENQTSVTVLQGLRAPARTDLRSQGRKAVIDAPPSSPGGGPWAALCAAFVLGSFNSLVSLLKRKLFPQMFIFANKLILLRYVCKPVKKSLMQWSRIIYLVTHPEFGLTWS